MRWCAGMKRRSVLGKIPTFRIVLNGARIGKNCIVGAGALVTGGTEIPEGWMAFGNPAKPVRRLRPEEIEGNRRSCETYLKEKERYRT